MFDNVIITVAPRLAVCLETAALEAIDVAKAVQKDVVFRFGDIRLIVSPKDSRQAVKDRYDAQVEALTR